MTVHEARSLHFIAAAPWPPTKEPHVEVCQEDGKPWPCPTIVALKDT